MQKIEQTLSSIEVAKMVEKDHAMLLRDLRRYDKQFTECKIAVSDFFPKIRIQRQYRKNASLLSHHQDRLRVHSA